MLSMYKVQHILTGKGVADGRRKKEEEEKEEALPVSKSMVSAGVDK